MKKIHTIFILLITLTFLFNACKDDPVTVKPPPPTPINDDMYIWDMKIFYGKYLRGTYAADTENVYINQGYNLFKYNGDTIVDVPLNDPGFEMYGIDGFDKENVFIGGGYNITGSHPILKKIQNGNVISYTISNDNGKQITDVLCTNPDEAWVSTCRSNYIYKYNGGNFKQFQLGDSVYYSYFFKDISGQLFSFGVRTSYVLDTGTIRYSEALHTYKLDIDTFLHVRVDTLYSPYTGEHKSLFLNRCGTDLMMTQSNEFAVIRFNGSNWENYLSYPPESPFPLSHIGGTSKDYLIIFAAYNGSMYIWNGNWNREDSFLAHIPYPGVELYGAGGPPIIIKESNVYFTVSAPLDTDSFFIIGRRNRTNNKEMYRLKK